MAFKTSFSRREFLSLMAGGVTAGLMAASPLAATARALKATDTAKFKAVAFDAFTVFDPRPIFALVEKFFPRQGVEFGRVWRNKQFDYAWLHLMEGHYRDFWSVTQDALTYSANMLKVDLTNEKRERLLNACLTLKAWPDAPVALDELRNMGMTLAFLSNFTPMMLQSNIRSAGLEDMFDASISTGMGRTYKPAPEAYQLAVDELDLDREEILYAPFAGWDTAGAKTFGLKTFWVDRLELPPEELGATPDGIGTSLIDVVNFVKG